MKLRALIGEIEKRVVIFVEVGKQWFLETSGSWIEKGKSDVMVMTGRHGPRFR